jgi:hypothetical protein
VRDEAFEAAFTSEKVIVKPKGFVIQDLLNGDADLFAL